MISKEVMRRSCEDNPDNFKKLNKKEIDTRQKGNARKKKFNSRHIYVYEPQHKQTKT